MLRLIVKYVDKSMQRSNSMDVSGRITSVDYPMCHSVDSCGGSAVVYVKWK